MLADPKSRGAGRQLRRPVAVPAQPEEPAAELATSSRTSTTTCGRRSQRETELFFAEHHARGPQRPRPDDRRLHVPERAARASTTACRTSTAATSAASRSPTTRARGCSGKGAILMVTSHADRTSPVVRGKWVLDNLLERAAAADAQQRAAAQRERGARRQGPDDARADGGAPRRIRCAPAATRSWTRSAWRWRTSTRSARGARATAARSAARSTRPGELLDGTKVDGVVTLRQALLQQPEIFVGTVDREAADLRARPRPRRTTTCRRCARSCATRRRRTTGSRRSCWASSTARRFRSGSR